MCFTFLKVYLFFLLICVKIAIFEVWCAGNSTGLPPSIKVADQRCVNVRVSEMLKRTVYCVREMYTVEERLLRFGHCQHCVHDVYVYFGGQLQLLLRSGIKSGLNWPEAKHLTTTP